MPYKNIAEDKIKKDNFYLSIINENLKGTIEESIIFLMPLVSHKRTAILRRMPETERNKIIPILKKSLYNKNKITQKTKFNNNKIFIQNILENSPCECGEKNTNKLELHHIDPSKKTRESIRALCNRTLEKLKEELKYCKVLCRNCHVILHNGNSSTHLKRLIDIYLNSRTKKRSGHKSKVLLFLYKLQQKCQKCNFNEAACLVFHHIQFDNKKNQICRMKGVPTLNKELAKTICLCQNCHNDFHALYGNKTNPTQLEEYLGKPVLPNIADLNDYQEEFKKLIS